MKIAVCVKYVPVVSRIGFDYENKTIIREGVPSEINPFDVLALVKALELKDQCNCEVVAVSMGPPQAKEGLIQCLALGADKAILLSDRIFAGSDTLATSRALSLVMERESPDLIMCGRNSADAETGQVGPELAEILGFPHVSQVRSLDFNSNNNVIHVERVTDEGYQEIECPLPAIACVTEGIAPERFAKREDIESIEETSIEEVNCASLDSEPSMFGIEGSPTWVEDIRLVEPNRSAEVISDMTPEQFGVFVRDKIFEFIKNTPNTSESGPNNVIERYSNPSNSIWVVAESSSNEIRHISFEMLGKAREIASITKSQVKALLIGEMDDSMVSLLGHYGADEVLHINNPPSEPVYSRKVIQTISETITASEPYAVLLGATADGRDMASRIAAHLDLGLTGDAIDLEVSEEGHLVQLKPALGGNVIAPIRSKTLPNMVTLRGGLLSPINPDVSYNPELTHLELSDFSGSGITLIQNHTSENIHALALDQSPIIIGIGMGVGDTGSVDRIRKLASMINAPLVTTRNVVHEGWLPHQVQVGISGRAIAPLIYIAVGIRGAFNHTVGIQKTGIIISINSNHRAPMFKASDYGVIGQWEEYLEPLIEQLKPISEYIDQNT